MQVYDPHFGVQIEPPHTDEDDLTDRMFAAEEQRLRDLAWGEAEGLRDLRPLEDNLPARLRFAAE